ncbi:hypothetical protein B0T18DRAFT_44181 [Schizothecium vesticola]|uniref:Secreted protein n=1 Tax=Schizothecium vesticola TaxID=314040 RepID=A0AA40FBR7_9PEZI|nr:hypothetical protein B0T18DRAFT_44181 [Schizothecium vesticola]
MLLYFCYLLAYLPFPLQPYTAIPQPCETVKVRGVGALFNSSGATPPLFFPLTLLTTSPPPTNPNAGWDRNNGSHYQGRPTYGADGGRMPHMVQACSGLTTARRSSQHPWSRNGCAADARLRFSINVYCLSDLSPVTKGGPAGVLWKHCGIEAHAEHPLAKL